MPVRSELRCSDIREHLSAHLDGELDPATEREILSHLETCADCRTYERELSDVKRAVALQPATPVPDLSRSIMARAVADTRSRNRERRVRFRIAIAAAVITALVLASSVLQNTTRSSGAALAAEVSKDVRAAAHDLTTYRATYSIVERGWHRLVPLRHFTADVWFKAPEHFRLEIRDRTDYPSGGWPTNNVDLVADPQRWSIKETTSCPTAALPVCGIEPRPARRTVVHRQPFDGTTALPTDIILPLESVAGSDGLRVVGTDVVAGRDAYHVLLPYWQAVPLVHSLEVGGSWRPFGADDRVDLWLDRQSWFPLRFTVTPATGSETALDVTATKLATPPQLAPGTFRVPKKGLSKDGGFVDNHSSGTTIDLGGLPLYRAGRVGLRLVRSYASGMSWLKITKEPYARPTLGVLTEAAVPVDGGVGYYEPFSDMLRRRLDIFGATSHVVIETNLPKETLVEVAGTQGVDGHAYPRLHVAGGTISRIDVDKASSLEYARAPSFVPVGYSADAALVTRTGSTRSLSLYYRRTQAGSDEDEIRITSTPTLHRLPPSSEDLVAVRLPDLTARWSSNRSELEWIDGTTYRSVSVPAFDLNTAIRIAESLAP
jgi:hypothetical protein